MLTVPQAPGPEGSLGCGAGRELPLALPVPLAELGRSQVGQHSKQGACESLPALSAQRLGLGAAGGQRQLLLLPLRGPVFSSAAPSLCAQQWGKASALQGRELPGSAQAVQPAGLDVLVHSLGSSTGPLILWVWIHPRSLAWITASVVSST